MRSLKSGGKAHKGRFVWAAMAIAAAIGPARADAVAEFYAGKTLTLISGFPPGGGYDAYTRLLQRHYGRHIPGRPAVVVSNMPGAGSLVAANHIYQSAPRDGTVLAVFSSSAAVEPILGNKAALFDPVRFSWIGSMAQDVAYCGVWQEAGAPSSFEEMRTKETIFGGGGTAAITYQHPMVLKNILGAKIRVVTGYSGTREINLAMNRGEVSGSCGLFTASIQSQWPDDVKSGRLKLVIQMGNKKSDTFGNVPSVFDYAKSEEDRAVLEVHFGQLLLARPLAGPPGIPPERLMALREAFLATMKDEQFLADATKNGIEIDPATGDEVQATLARFAAFPKPTLARAAEAMSR